MRKTAIWIAALLSFLICAPNCPADDAPLQLNALERDWYPFLFKQDGLPQGIFYDIVGKALASLEIKSEIAFVPVKRAIHYAKYGKADGIIALGYQSGLEPFLDYPPGADTGAESAWRIIQIDHVVVSSATGNYEYDGDLKTIPHPVRILTGAPIVENLEKTGVRYETVANDSQNFGKLIRDGNGAIITTSVVAEIMNRKPIYRNKIKISATPVSSDSYHLVFSKKSRLSGAEKQRLWQEIARWRNDYIFMLQVFSQY